MVPWEERVGGHSIGKGRSWFPRGGGRPAGGDPIRGVGCTAQPEGFASEEEVGWKELRLYLVGATAVNQWLAVSAAAT